MYKTKSPEYTLSEIIKGFSAATDTGEPVPFQLEEPDNGKGIVSCTYTHRADPRENIRLTASWKFPMRDVLGMWHPVVQKDRALCADFSPQLESMTAISAPVLCLYNGTGDNRFTFALSEVKKPVQYSCFLHEEDSTFVPRISIELPALETGDTYQFQVYLDIKGQPYYQALAGVSKWWEEISSNPPMAVPVAAWEPFYSTWYSFHQDLTADSLEKECLTAAEMGCKAVILDDGWQTDDGNRGYAYCGDWDFTEKKFPDVKQHVANVHAMDMKYMIWLSVPFVGKNSTLWERFSGKLLSYDPSRQAGVLDIRYPEVREYLIEKYAQLMEDYDLDGLKLDFIDEFRQRTETPAHTCGMDYRCVQDALDHLMLDIKNRLTHIKPDILIEFRQRYIGPNMRSYGNLFRVCDCPGAMDTNRVGIIDLRLLSGNTAVHSDMLLWHPEDSAQDAALFLINCLFSVVQVSVRFHDIPEEHRQMLRFWLSFMRRHRQTLLQSELVPYDPQYLYPLVAAQRKTGDTDTDGISERILAVYQPEKTIPYDPCYRNTYIANASHTEKIILKLPENKEAHAACFDCMGKVVWEQELALRTGYEELAVPKGGLLKLV